MRETFYLTGLICMLCLALAVPATAANGNAQEKEVTIRARAVGSPEITPVEQRSLRNGDFTIYTNSTEGPFPVGDGIDEFTVWRFSFYGDPHYLEFMDLNAPLESAVISLKVKLKAKSGYCDAVWIQDTVHSFKERWRFRIPENCMLNKDEWKTLTFDFSILYPKRRILEILECTNSTIHHPPHFFHLVTAYKKGQIAMVIHDDTQICEATLTLTKKK